MDVSKRFCDGEHKAFFGMKEGCKVFCVKLVAWSIVAQKGSNIPIFNVFEYGRECSAESGAKYYFIVWMEIAKYNRIELSSS